MVVDGVAGGHADEGDEQEDDGEGIQCFGGEVETEHCMNCSETEEGEKLNVVLEGQF